MNKTNVTVASTKGTSKLVRAKFGPGMLLQHEDLEQLNSYTRDLSRLMFRSLFGCGVICGLKVSTESKCGKVEVTVEPGVALACSGDPIYVPTDQKFALDENCDPDIDSPLWVVLCGTVKHCAPRTATCSSDDDEAPSVPTRERDGFEIRVVSKLPECVCGCTKPEDNNYVPQDEAKCQCADPNLKCYEDHYQGKCGCNCDECSGGDCKGILLARLRWGSVGDTENWFVDHGVRRFIRPVLMRDPQVEIERARKVEIEEKAQKDAQLRLMSMHDTQVEIEKQARKDAQLRSVLMPDIHVEIEEQARKEASYLPQKAPASQAKKQSTASTAKKQTKTSSKQPKSGRSSNT